MLRAACCVQPCVRLAARSGIGNLSGNEQRETCLRAALKLPRTRPSKAQLGVRQLLISPIDLFLLFFSKTSG